MLRSAGSRTEPIENCAARQLGKKNERNSHCVCAEQSGTIFLSTPHFARNLFHLLRLLIMVRLSFGTFAAKLWNFRKEIVWCTEQNQESLNAVAVYLHWEHNTAVCAVYCLRSVNLQARTHILINGTREGSGDSINACAERTLLVRTHLEYTWRGLTCRTHLCVCAQTHLLFNAPICAVLCIVIYCSLSLDILRCARHTATKYNRRIANYRISFFSHVCACIYLHFMGLISSARYTHVKVTMKQYKIPSIYCMRCVQVDFENTRFDSGSNAVWDNVSWLIS